MIVVLLYVFTTAVGITKFGGFCRFYWLSCACLLVYFVVVFLPLFGCLFCLRWLSCVAFFIFHFLVFMGGWVRLIGVLFC